MTVPQIKGFMEAILRRTAMINAIFVSNIAVGAQASSKDIKKAVETYSNQRKKQVKSTPQVKRLTVRKGEALSPSDNPILE